MPEPRKVRRAPGPSRWVDALTNLAAVGADPLAFFTRLQREHGNLVNMRFPRLVTHLVSDPDLVRQVLQERQQLYRKGLEYELMKPLLGEGLLTSDGSFWKRQRRLAQPAFHKQHVNAFAEVMVARAAALAERWRARPGRTDVHADMMALTLAVVGEALFGVELTAESSEVASSLHGLLDFFSVRNRSLWMLVPIGVPLPSHRKFFADRAVLGGVVDRIIAARRASGETGRRDLLSMLMAARADADGAGVGDTADGEGMSDVQLRDEAMTMLLAGHETTANLLTWTWLLLAQNPERAERLRASVASAIGDAPPTLDDLPKLGEVDRVLKESLRLYPPAWAIARVLTADDEMRGHRLAAGSQVIISQYVIHRRADLWPDPEAFDPDRFLEGAEKGRPRFAYFPFGGGPRQCIGTAFAMLEAQLILVVLLQRTRLNVDLGQPIALDASITLRPRHGLFATVGPSAARDLPPPPRLGSAQARG